MLSRIANIIGPDDIGTLICLAALSVLIAMTAFNWLSFWGAL